MNLMRVMSTNGLDELRESDELDESNEIKEF